MSTELKEQERKQIDALVSSTIAHGNYRMSNMSSSYLQPMLSSNDSKSHIVSALERVITSCKQQVTRAINDFESQCGYNSSHVLNDMKNLLVSIESYLLQKII